MLLPKIAYARINGGTAELVEDPNVKPTETAAAPAPAKIETATAPAQTAASKPTPPADDKKKTRR